MDLEKIGVLTVSIITGVIGLAIIAVIVSQRANTVGVIQAGSSGLASIINAAVQPVVGSGGGFGG